MIRPATRFAFGVVVLSGVLAACSDAGTVASPQNTTALGARHTVSVPSSDPGPMRSRAAASYCADVTNASQDPGAPLSLWTCAGQSAPSQQFSWQPNGELHIYGTMCVEAVYNRGKDGNAAVVQTCTGTGAQQWHYTAGGEIRDNAGNCLGIKGRLQLGMRLLMRGCDGSTAQQWDVPMTTIEVADGDTATTSPTNDPPADTTPTNPTTDPPPVSSPVVIGSSGPAELPRAQVDVQAPAVTGSSIRVAAGQDLQAAIDAARPGDELVLDAGATYVGNFILRQKSGDGWITIRTNTWLPAAGTRVTPAAASSFAKIQTGNIMPVFITEVGAHNFRLAGVDIGAAPGVPKVYSLVTLGDAGTGQISLSQVPHHIILDRVYVHGSPSVDLRRCVALNSAWTAIVDSWLAECHSNDGDSQAIWGSNGPGPFTIVNNHLEGGGENIMFGGADSRSSELMPRDITIRRNHIVKPLSWMGVWVTKNLFELKAGQRVLLEGNVMEGCWADAQVGFAILLKSSNQDGSAPWSTTSDVTIRYNRLSRSASGIQIAGSMPGEYVTNSTSRIVIEQNLFDPVGDPVLGGGGRLFTNGSMTAPRDVVFRHNTGFGLHAGFIFYEGVQSGFVFADNIVNGHPEYQWGFSSADGHGVGTNALDYHAPGWLAAGNVFVAGAAPPQPGNNYYPASMSAVGFANPGAPIGAGFTPGDYRLTSGSPYKGKATDGSDPGVNYDQLNAILAGVVVI